MVKLGGLAVLNLTACNHAYEDPTGNLSGFPTRRPEDATDGAENVNENESKEKLDW